MKIRMKVKLEDPLSQNLYTYVENNSLIYADPSGNASALVKSCALLCFAAGTMIETSDGLKAIEEIEVGDYVLAKSDETGNLAYKPVEETFNRITKETYHLYVGSVTIVTTAEHPFWVVGKGWVESKDLHEGDVFVTDEGTEYVLERIEIKEEKIRVYNFSVGDYHTYFVSNLKIWTHNCGGSRAGGGSLSGYSLNTAMRGGGGYKLPSSVTSPKQPPVVMPNPIKQQLEKAIAQIQKNKVTGKVGNSPNFVVTPKGDAIPIPKSATGPNPVVNPKGNVTGQSYNGGQGGANKQVDSVRIMDPTPPRGNSPGYLGGYIKYENKAQQGVDPITGRTIPNSKSHIPLTH
ncbi:polymorphic toxin-type HINT domain-containing protein [Paenibacillus glucanolyticus]|uniref:polymorphic toxin-type HINT domain-containing protein n=1 Tax=Paenibacillus glucanolyticus TaxID=59843 RepID=UPI0036BCD767